MNKHQDKDSSPEEKYVTIFNKLIFALAGLVLCAAGLHLLADAVQQRELTQALFSSHQAAAMVDPAENTQPIRTPEPQSGFGILTYISMILYLLMLSGLAYMYLNIFRPAISTLEELRKQLSRNAAIDQLTGVYNRPMLFKVGRQLISAAKRHKQPLTVISLDIDKLRKVNENYGRAAGDALIKTVATTISSTLRSSDVIGRLGGGELGIFLPAIDKLRAPHVAEKVRAAIEEMHFNIKTTTVLATASIGVVEMTEHHNDPDGLFLSAELALRRAKEEGGNRAVMFSLIDAAASNQSR